MIVADDSWPALSRFAMRVNQGRGIDFKPLLRIGRDIGRRQKLRNHALFTKHQTAPLQVRGCPSIDQDSVQQRS
jgi:hypothetical protein